MKKLFLLAAVFATTLLVSCDKEDKEWLQDTVGNGVDNLTSKEAKNTETIELNSAAQTEQVSK